MVALAVVFTPACHQRRLANCDWMPASYTNGQSSYPCGYPTCWAPPRRGHTVSIMPCHRAWTSAPLSAHLSTGWECMTSQIETPVCARRIIHQFIWLQQKWADHRWNVERLENTTRLRTFIPDIGTQPPRMVQPLTMWVRFNRLRTGVGRLLSCLHKWSMALSTACECGAEEKTAVLSFTMQP